MPPAWLKAYPSLLRLDQLRRWIDKGYPVCYWLAGFTYPTAFLTAVLQVCVCVFVFVWVCLVVHSGTN